MYDKKLLTLNKICFERQKIQEEKFCRPPAQNQRTSVPLLSALLHNQPGNLSTLETHKNFLRGWIFFSLFHVI